MIIGSSTWDVFKINSYVLLNEGHQMIVSIRFYYTQIRIVKSTNLLAHERIDNSKAYNLI